MEKLKLYSTTDSYVQGNTVRCDTALYVAVMNEAVKNGILTYPDYVRSLLAAVCLDKTYGNITEQHGLKAGTPYYTESDINVFKSQIEELKSLGITYSQEIRSKEVAIENLQNKHYAEITKLHETIQSLQNQLIEVMNNEVPISVPVVPVLNQSVPVVPLFTQSVPVVPQSSGTQFQEAGTGGRNDQFSGLDLSEFGRNQPVPPIVPVDINELIQERFVEVVGNEIVVEYFNQKEKMNQSFGISGFNGTFKMVEEIPNSLLEHHPLVVYWKKMVGQYENAIVNATEAFFEKANSVQQLTQNEQQALSLLLKREEMLWWLITHFTTIRGFDTKYFEYLMNTVRTQCQGFPAIPNPYHGNILNAKNQQYGEQ